MPFVSLHMNNLMESWGLISVQLTRRFLDSKVYAPIKWPSEFNTEFMPLLEKFRYQQGLLMQSTIEIMSSDSVDVHITTPLLQYMNLYGSHKRFLF